MTAENSNVCKGGPKLVFACSGAADVGAIADKAARKMTLEGTGCMFCLAGISGRIDPIMKKTETADRILAIDGQQATRFTRVCIQTAWFAASNGRGLSIVKRRLSC